VCIQKSAQHSIAQFFWRRANAQPRYLAQRNPLINRGLFHAEQGDLNAAKGKGTLDVGGEKRDFDIEGKREK
jgi:hypothetical protein